MTADDVVAEFEDASQYIKEFNPMKRREFIIKSTFAGIALSTATPLWNTLAARAAEGDIPLVENSAARVAIYAPSAIMAADKPLGKKPGFLENQAETQRRHLRESVNDLALYLEKMSGAKIEVLQRAPAAGDTLTPILIGEYAQQKFGAPKQTSTFKQGFRMTAQKGAIGLQGETDEAASYAIYELLDRLGCRWFLPGEMGESIPQNKNLRLPEIDFSAVPSTHYRGIWYADEAFMRRNRLGGFNVRANHALEGYITQKQREEHPEWRAVIKGKPHKTRLKWSNLEVSDAIADAIIAKLDKNYTPSVSLSPNDGAAFDQTDDTKLDAGDWDTSMNQISITDRYVNLCNRIAERVTKKYPDVRFGFLAYVQYTRPPVREKLHPNLVPQIAPITYCRAHAMTDTAICPSRPQLRPIVEGWGKVAPGRVSYYNYMYHLAEPTAPYPMMHQMSEELPILYANGVTFWQPETLPNFEESLPGMWLSLRMAWNNKLQPQQVLDEFFTQFYGATSVPMRRYWQTFDDAYTDVPEHAGGAWGYLRRFTPGVLQAARAAIDEATKSAQTPMEQQRVKMQDESLRQFERFMAMRHDLAEGRLADLDTRSAAWMEKQIALGNEYSDNFAFSKLRWTPLTAGGFYFKTFYEATYNEAARVAREYSLLGEPLRRWKYQVAQKQDGEALGWQKPEFNDAAWKTTDPAVDTWFDLGLGEYYGSVWYRQTVPLPALPAGKKVYLLVPATDGSAKVFVNGQPIPYVNAKGETSDAASGYAQPFSFDVTAAVKPNAPNQITIIGTRLSLNELGTGGLLEPVYLYREK